MTAATWRAVMRAAATASQPRKSGESLLVVRCLSAASNAAAHVAGWAAKAAESSGAQESPVARQHSAMGKFQAQR
jgi:hypothetical protein